MSDPRKVCGTCEHWCSYSSTARETDIGECLWEPENGFPISFVKHVLREVLETYYETYAEACPQYLRREGEIDG